MARKKSDAAVHNSFSQLPQPILQNILCHLHIKEAFRANILSESWSNACKSLPELTFDEEFSSTPNGVDNDSQVKAKLSHVDKVLNRQINHNKAGVEAFLLGIPCYCEPMIFDTAHYMDNFIALATQGNVQKLTLRHGCAPVRISGVYHAKSLTALELTGFVLEPPTHGGGFKFSALKVLNLLDCVIESKLVELFLTSCKELENFALSNCHEVNVLHIGGFLQKLKSVHLDYNNNEVKKIEIGAPNLERLYIDNICRLSSLEINACKNLNHLTLRNFTFTDTLDIVDINFPFLETPQLAHVNYFEKLRISGNNLKHLDLESLPNVDETYIDAPNLISFSFGAFLIMILFGILNNINKL